MSGGERRAALRGVASALRYLLLGGLLAAMDFLLFWILEQVRLLAPGDVRARAPVTVAVSVEGGGHAAEIYRDLVSAFSGLQSADLTLLSAKCLPEPSEPDHWTYGLLGFLLGLALLVSVGGGFVLRCRRLICAAFHPQRERVGRTEPGPVEPTGSVFCSQERIRFLRQQILDQRGALAAALRRTGPNRFRPDRLPPGEAPPLHGGVSVATESPEDSDLSEADMEYQYRPRPPDYNSEESEENLQDEDRDQDRCSVIKIN